MHLVQPFLHLLNYHEAASRPQSWKPQEEIPSRPQIRQVMVLSDVAEVYQDATNLNRF
jgi:hypothetical protein